MNVLKILTKLQICADQVLFMSTIHVKTKKVRAEASQSEVRSFARAVQHYACTFLKQPEHVRKDNLEGIHEMDKMMLVKVC